jgi:peptidyl-prolyl cis-trans isomerase B (cyclophilin B)
VDDEPVGAALVIQPMLSRMVPVTRVAPHPTRGHPHTRIDGWEVESEGPPAAAPSTGEPAAAPRKRVLSGVRLYPERDVILRTTMGEIRVALCAHHAPNTAWNFRHLVEGGFYRDVVFHRVVPQTREGDGFVIQAGDPTASGDGGPGYWLPIEPSDLPHDYGVISMARADHPDSAGSQFFFCLSRAGTARLDGQYCAFGYAVDGAATIQAIAAVDLADVSRGLPVDPPVILEAILVPSPPRIPGQGRPDQRVSPPPPEAPAALPTHPGRVPR